MKKFSIVFPTRERVSLLNDLLNSINANTFNIDDVEVLIAVDEDDTVTRSYLAEYRFPFVKVFPVPRSEDMNFSRDYYNMLVRASTGKWIIACNDDAKFETAGWDVRAEKTLNAFIGDGPNIVYGWIEDKLGGWRAKGHGDYCCFPLLGREGIETLGYFFPEDIPNWGADIWAKNLYDNIGRAVRLPMIIGHYNYHNQTREQDAISKRIQDNQVGFDMKATYEQINKLLKVFRQKKAALANA